jgi:secondary thiamine-phosphate synthase enzyme
MVETFTITKQTKGNNDILDITPDVSSALSQSGMTNGVVTIYSPSTTSAVTTIEYESGCLNDLRRLFDEITDPARSYAHNERWGDGNGYSHVRAALLGPSLTIPFIQQRLMLGTWQQIIFIDFDIRPRQRKIIVQIMGE